MPGNGSYEYEHVIVIMQVWSVGLIVLSTIATTANVFLICVMIHGHMLTATTAKLILNLALHDFAASFAHLFAGINGFYFLEHNEEEMADQRHRSLESCFRHASYILLTVAGESVAVLTVSFDRYLAITKPVVYKALSTKYQRFMILLSWSVGMVLTMTLYVFTDDTKIVYCSPIRSLTHSGRLVWNMFNAVTSAGVVTTLVASYRSVRKLHESTGGVDQKVKKSLDSLILIAAMYAATYVVGTILNLGAVLSIMDHQNQFFFEIYVSWLMAFNFGSNFFVYVIRAEDYRCNFKKLILRKSKGHCNQVLPTRARNQPVSLVTGRIDHTCVLSWNSSR